MSFYASMSLFAALFTFNLGLVVYLKSSRGKLTSLFYLFAMAVALLGFSQFQMRIASNFNDAYLWSKVSAIWPFTQILAIHFILELNRKKYRSFLIYFFLYLPGLVITYIQFSTNLIALPPIEQYWGWSIQYIDSGFLYFFTLSYLFSYWMITISLLIYFYISFKGKAKTQVLLICIGFLLNFITSVTSDVAFPIFGINVPEFGSASDAITFSLIAYGIWRYDLFRLSEDDLSNKLFSSISNYLVLVDANRKILEINNKFLNRLNYSFDEISGQNLNYILAAKQQTENPLSSHIQQYSTFENKELIFNTKDGDKVPLTFTASYVKLHGSLNSGLIYVGTESGLHKQNQLFYKENDNQTNFLAEAALDLVKLSSTDDIYQYITTKIYSLLHKKAIIACVEDKEGIGYLNWEIKGIEGIHSKAKELSSLLGFDLTKLKGHSKVKHIKDLPDGKLSVIDLKITEYTNGMIPDVAGKKIIKLFGLKELNVIPILHENKISGVISIVKLKNTPPINLELLESFVAIASMVLKRKYYENELAELNNMQNKLFSVIGHDLKSPLSNVLSYTDMILCDYDSFTKDYLREFFQSIQRSANTGFDILNSLLLWSKSVQGGIPLKPELINIKEMVSEAIEQVLPLAIKKKITISNMVENDIFISADKNMTVTVFRNILSNAVKFTNPSGHIKFSASNYRATVKIFIADNGIGMNQIQISNLFKIDKLLIGRGTEGEKGSGFGLLICKEFVENNGGRIEVESQINEGSVFTLVFPQVNENR